MSRSSSPRASRPSPQPAHPWSRPFRAAAYRVYQFGRSIAPRPLDAEDRAILDATLPSSGRALFATMSPSDQRHSLTVYRALRDTGCDDAELLAAALLHDSGKGSGRVRLWVRPPLVLLKAFAPGLLHRLTREPPSGQRVPWWRRPLYDAWHHAAIGADLAARAGLSPRTVELIRTHHDPHGPAAALHAVDDAV